MWIGSRLLVGFGWEGRSGREVEGKLRPWNSGALRRGEEHPQRGRWSRHGAGPPRVFHSLLVERRYSLRSSSRRPSAMSSRPVGGKPREARAIIGRPPRTGIAQRGRHVGKWRFPSGKRGVARRPKWARGRSSGRRKGSSRAPRKRPIYLGERRRRAHSATREFHSTTPAAIRGGTRAPDTSDS